MKRLLLLILAFGLLASVAYAHNGMHHIMGTVTAITDTSVTVKTTDGKTQTIGLTAETKYKKGEAAMTVKDIKVGEHIVIHAAMKSGHMVAAEVMVGGMKMKGMSE